MADDQNRWIRRFRSAPDARTQLVCLPHAGGAASYYRPMALRLWPDVEVLAVQYPGRQNRANEPCVENFADLTDQVVAAVRPELDRPVALFGHSMGTLLAFEVAKRLEADGVVPVVLFASGRRAPGRPQPEPDHRASDDDLVAEIAELNGTEDRLLENEDMRPLFLLALRADYRAIETYHHDPKSMVACPVVALTGDSDNRVSIDDAASWATQTTGSFDLHVFPGDHFYLNHQLAPLTDVLVQQLGALRGDSVTSNIGTAAGGPGVWPPLTASRSPVTNRPPGEAR
ncbi:thioesterase II family protein [Actinophytocola sp.]|uniref:thioesterase II family protein n=1 Tax=Actinophytocola sp. TaxID=1872138 RepID=UPI003D6B6006